jgi:hypothetical protein
VGLVGQVTNLSPTCVIDLLHRLIQGTLRTLLGLRRAPAAVVVRRVGQLNVAAGPQMNVNGVTDRNADATGL